MSWMKVPKWLRRKPRQANGLVDGDKLLCVENIHGYEGLFKPLRTYLVRIRDMDTFGTQCCTVSEVCEVRPSGTFFLKETGTGRYWAVYPFAGTPVAVFVRVEQ
jgi:hypothetical protein